MLNRKLDTLVAEHVMGWRKVQLPKLDGYWIVCCKDHPFHWLDPEPTLNGAANYICSNDDVHWWTSPNYSDDIREAYKVLESFRKGNKYLNLPPATITLNITKESTTCTIYTNDKSVTVVNKHTEHAICVAALKMAGIDYVE